MTDYLQEQEDEIEVLRSIFMDEIKDLDPNESGLNTTSKCYQIAISAIDDDQDELERNPVKLALNFAHTPNYPDDPPLLELRSLRAVKVNDLKEIKEKLQQEAMENLGMAMMYTLASSAKEWLQEKYGLDVVDDTNDSPAETKDEVIEPHGEAVTVDTFLAWRERFEAEKALERARLMPESALVASKEKKLTGRSWFESGALKGAKPVVELEEDEEEMEFDEDFDEGDIDEDDMLEHYLAGK